MKKLLKMALFAALPLAAMMMFSSYYGGPENNPCPPPGDDYYTVLVPVPGDCSSFYACSNGVPVLQHCPDGLVFNDELDSCEVPYDDSPCGVSGGGSLNRYWAMRYCPGTSDMRMTCVSERLPQECRRDECVE